MADRKHRETHHSHLALGRHEEELLRREARQREESQEVGEGVLLHVCEACESDLVYPTDWAPAGTRHWSVQLRCPNCEWEGNGIYGQDVVDRFDEVLDDGTEAVLDDLMRLTHANMEDDIDRFVAALDKDHILPEDF